MHIPAKFKETNTESLYQFIRQYPLGTLVTGQNQSLEANHIPFLLSQNTEGATLQSHIAKANPLWKNCENGIEVLLIFHGPNAYISPNYYPSKAIDGMVVPTWNYSVVHVKGKITFIHDGHWIMELLNNISNTQEANQEKPWSITDAPTDFIGKLSKAVVGVEVTIDSIEGNFKLSQNKNEADWMGVISGLEQSTDDNNKIVAAQMRDNKNNH